MSKSLKREVEQLANLASAGQLAAHLQEHGASGVPFNTDYCVLSRHLTRLCGLTVRVDETKIESDGEAIPTPPSIVNFLSDFDGMRHEKLVDWDLTHQAYLSDDLEQDEKVSSILTEEWKQRIEVSIKAIGYKPGLVACHTNEKFHIVIITEEYGYSLYGNLHYSTGRISIAGDVTMSVTRKNGAGLARMKYRAETKRPSRNRPFRWSGVECTLAA